MKVTGSGLKEGLEHFDRHRVRIRSFEGLPFSTLVCTVGLPTFQCLWRNNYNFSTKPLANSYQQFSMVQWRVLLPAFDCVCWR